jgi:transcriptional antiterminator RfaH
MLSAYWHVIHTKPRQEQRALLNLQQQGYTCYLPLLATEKLCRGTPTVAQEPLFPRYLFIQLDTAQTGKSWGPIRSTLGVSRLVTFGIEPAKASPELIDSLRAKVAGTHTQPMRLFSPGDRVQIKNGPFMGLQGIYHMDDGERRAMVLMELLSKPCKLAFEPANLHKL